MNVWGKDFNENGIKNEYALFWVISINYSFNFVKD